jgi:hypothetical protein
MGCRVSFFFLPTFFSLGGGGGGGRGMNEQNNACMHGRKKEIMNGWMDTHDRRTWI